MTRSAFLALLLALAAPAFAQHQGHGAHAGHGEAAAAPAIDTKTHLNEDHFKTLDANGDGFVVKSELPAGHPLLGHFPMADRGRDGKLDAREFKALVGMQ